MVMARTLGHSVFGAITVDELSFVDPNTETLAGGKTLTETDKTVHFLDPGGSGRAITLPAEANSVGRVFIIFNTADADEALTISEDGTTTRATITQNESCILVCDGTSWRGLVGTIS